MPICTGLGLDKSAAFYKKSLLLLSFGRIAQRESVPFTRERSKVRSLVRPPSNTLKYLTNLPKLRHARKASMSFEGRNRVGTPVQNPCMATHDVLYALVRLGQHL
jgi:hypothetical protein